MSDRQHRPVGEAAPKEGAGVAAPNTLTNNCLSESTRSDHKRQSKLSLRVERIHTLPTLALRPNDAAKALGLGVRKLWQETQPRGPIPCVRLGKAVIYPVDQLREWLAKECGEVSR